MESQERKKYADIGYKPFVFFVVFGVTENELQVSASKHHVDAFPEGLEAHTLNRNDHADYINGFFGGPLGNVLKSADPDLFDKCKGEDNCLILKGEIKDDSTFDYMRNIIGIMQALIDHGAVGILDFLTFNLYSPDKWTEKFFEKEVNAQNHVMILYSKEEDGYWLHTRGMAEFGRPDYSVEGVAEGDIDEFEKVVNQMIFYGGEGVLFNGSFRLHTSTGNSYNVKSEFVSDFDNDDFNNAYCKVSISLDTES